MTFIPVLKYMPGITDVCDQLMKNRDEMLEFVRHIVADHKETLDPAAPRDLVDIYLVEMAKEKKEEEAEADCEDPARQLEQILLDIFSAGVETLKTSLPVVHPPHAAQPRGQNT